MTPSTQIVFTALVSAFTSSGFMSLIVFLIQRHDKRRDLLFGLGHDKIIYLTDRYVKRGAITLKEKRNLEILYTPYIAMGGNGDCKVGYEACQRLKIVSDDDAEQMDAILKRKEYGLDVK